MMMSTKCDYLLQYLRREINSPIPYDIGFNQNAEKEFSAILKGKTEREYFDCCTRDVRPDLLKARIDYDFSSLYPEGTLKGGLFDEWGILTSTRGKGLVHVINPMSQFEDAKELLDYPFPDYSNSDCYAAMKKNVEEIHRQGLAAVAKAERMIFAMGRDLRGYENHLMDYCDNDEFLDALLDKILECQVSLVKGMAGTGVDIIWLSSDVASQHDVFLRPSVYHEKVAWRMRELFHAAKEVNPEILCSYHCCGNVVPIMNDILEFGIDILNPIQPESLDFPSFKGKYGDKLILWGGISVQHTMPNGTVEDVRAEVRSTGKILGSGGAFVISPSNEITEDIPFENIEAFIDESKRLSAL